MRQAALPGWMAPAGCPDGWSAGCTMRVCPDTGLTSTLGANFSARIAILSTSSSRMLKSAMVRYVTCTQQPKPTTPPMSDALPATAIAQATACCTLNRQTGAGSLPVLDRTTVWDYLRSTHQLLHHLHSCSPVTHGEQQVQRAPPDGHVRVLQVGKDGGLQVRASALTHTAWQSSLFVTPPGLVLAYPLACAGISRVTWNNVTRSLHHRAETGQGGNDGLLHTPGARVCSPAPLAQGPGV